jgi:hypothetical protein
MIPIRRRDNIPTPRVEMLAQARYCHLGDGLGGMQGPFCGLPLAGQQNSSTDSTNRRKETTIAKTIQRHWHRRFPQRG